MATIPSPVTWSPGDIPTDAYFNRDIRDAVTFFLRPPRCQLRQSASLDTPGVTWTLLNWDTEVADSEAMHDPSTNPSRINIITAGRYDVDAQLRWENHTIAGDNGGIQLMIRRNAAGSATGGTLVVIESKHALDGNAQSALSPYGQVWAQPVLAAGDYLECFARHSYSSNSALRFADDRSAGFGVLWCSAQ